MNLKRVLTQAEFDEKYLLHQEYLSSEGKSGEVANFFSCDFLKIKFPAKINLSRANLSGADLTEVNLSGANLSGIDMEGANLSRANLQKANLSGANLLGARLNGADLVKANLNGAHLKAANLWLANLNEANLSGANLESTKLPMANLIGVNLSRANLMLANVREAYLTHANLTQANLLGTDLFRADLRYANLSGANFEGADLMGAKLEKTNLAGTNLEGANLSGTILGSGKKSGDIDTAQQEKLLNLENQLQELKSAREADSELIKEKNKEIENLKKDLEKRSSEIDKGLENAFNQLSSADSTMQPEIGRLQLLFTSFLSLSVMCFLLLGLIWWLALCKFHYGNATASWNEIWVYSIPSTICIGFMWAGIVQLNRAQRQLVGLKKENRKYHHVKMALQGYYSVENILNKKPDKAKEVFDEIIKQTLSDDPNCDIEEKKIERNTSKDQLPVKEALDGLIDYAAKARKLV